METHGDIRQCLSEIMEQSLGCDGEQIRCTGAVGLEERRKEDMPWRV